VLLLTINERLPYLVLAGLAWSLTGLQSNLALGLTFSMLVWQGLGGGFTATAWQCLIGKIIPADRRGFFLGLQAAASNLLGSAGAALSGFIIEGFPFPKNYAWVFIAASLSLVLSWIFLALTRESAAPPVENPLGFGAFWRSVGGILRRDHNFRWFLLIRAVSQLAVSSIGFYAVFAVHQFHLKESQAGLMTSIYMLTQIVANPVMGWLGDRTSHRTVMGLGVLAASLSAGLAWLATSAVWFYLAFVLAGIAVVAVWTIAMTLTLEFGATAERPTYIGLSNTLVAPLALLGPLMGGWLADRSSYPTTFIISAFWGLLAAAITFGRLRPPRTLARPTDQPVLPEKLT
jgi:MFS family permease